MIWLKGESTMLTLPFVILFTVLAFFLSKQIRKQDKIIYFVTLVIAVLAVIFRNVPFLRPISQGYIGLALFYIVMITGALPKKSKLRIELSKVRKEYSIIGFILITPHATKYLINFFTGLIDIPIFGIIAYVIMIPLFITSFTYFRKKFSYKSWKKIQSAAYIVYIILFIHLLFVSDTIAKMNLILYIVLFFIYFTTKIYYEIKSRHKKNLTNK